MPDELADGSVPPAPAGSKQVEHQCSNCGASGTCHLELRLAVDAIGTYSLAGNQPKVSAHSVPFLVCRACGTELQGWIEGNQAVFDPRSKVGE